MNGKLSGKTVLVTGASKGIGQGLAKGIAAAGAQTAVNYKTDSEGANTTCRIIREGGGEADSFQADVGSKLEFENLVDSVCERFGKLDVLVNNAGRTRFGPWLEVTEEDFDDVMNTNLRGPFFGTVAAAKKMLECGGGSIINISSCAVSLIVEYHSVYTAIKGGLESLTRQLAIELGPKIRVNAISPGPTSNERNRGYDQDYDKNWGAIIPAGRVAYPEDYVGPCVFLSSDDSKFLTGEVLHVDGGWTLRGYTPDMSKLDLSDERERG